MDKANTGAADRDQRQFGLRVVQHFDASTQKVSTQVETFGHGMSIHEAITHIELWLETVKKRLKEQFDKNFQAQF